MINEDINEIIEQIFTLNDIFNEKNSLRIEEIYIQNDLITLRKKFPFELFEIDFISYIIYFINNYSDIFPDQKNEQLGKVEWNHNASDEIKYRIKFGHPRKEVGKENEDDKESETDKVEIEEAPKKSRTRKRKTNDNEDDKVIKTKSKGRKAKSAKTDAEENEAEISKLVESSTSSNAVTVSSTTNDKSEQEVKPEESISEEPTIEVVKQKRHTKKRWNETQEKFLEECIRENNFVIDPKKFYAEHGPNGTKSHNLGEFTVNNIRDKCKSEKRKRMKKNKNLGAYENSINNSFHIQMEIKNELVNNKRVPNCRRRRWTDEQLKCLEQCILESNGNIYPSLILNLHGPNGIQSNILGNQTRQSIHDKCKNEKWRRIQQGLPLGAFEKAAKKSISSIGNKWKNTKVLKDYVASTEGKRRKRNIDPYYKPENQKKNKKRKSTSESTEDSENINDSTVNSSNITSQVQENDESSSTFVNPNFNLNHSNFTENFNGFNSNESSSSFIRVNETNQDINTNSENFNGILSTSSYNQTERNEVAFPFIPANNDSNDANGSNSNVYINTDVNNTNINNDKTQNTNIPNKQEFGNDNPYQLNEKETTNLIYSQNTNIKIEQPINTTTIATLTKSITPTVATTASEISTSTLSKETTDVKVDTLNPERIGQNSKDEDSSKV
jgi:hypothetical protein